jgi:hypothetical protein
VDIDIVPLLKVRFGGLRSSFVRHRISSVCSLFKKLFLVQYSVKVAIVAGYFTSLWQ